MAVKNFDKKLDAVISTQKSNWKNKAAWRQKNKHWLKHSQRIAIELNQVLKDRKMTQKQLAALLKISPAQVSKIMKGRENFTIETISNLEQALGINLIFKEQKKENVVIKVSYETSFTTSKQSPSTYQAKKLISNQNKRFSDVCIN